MDRPALHELAERAGILPSYVDAAGVERRTSDATRIAVLAAMGIEARDEGAARAELARMEAAARARPWEPARVVRAGVPARLAWRGAAGGRVEVRLESGAVERLEVRRGARSARLPPLPPGVHEARLDADGPEPAAQRLVAVPARCLPLREKLDARAAFGVWANLYSVRSERGLGIGDLTDLVELARFAGRHGAAFAGINPLHAHRNRPPDISPYAGLSRIFRNPIYLDVEAVPELASCEAARALLAESQPSLARLRAAERVDYAAVAALQRPLLAALHGTFARQTLPQGGERAAAYREFRARDGGLVVDFGVFLALMDAMAAEGRGPDWRRWPAELRDPRSAAVRAFAERHAEAVERHVFAQFELDRQLAAASSAAREAGLPLGLYQDLALGAAPSGFDAWAFARATVPGVSLGAPPDDYAQGGQEWAIPPLDPRRLAEDGYGLWRLVLRASMEHSGLLRIDHAMSLTRQFWVLEGRPAAEGCYVRYPMRDLLGVVALMSHRHRCAVVAEDLGTVPSGFAGALARAGVLSSRVLLFERTADGRFRAASRYSKRALVTANTHDLPTLAGWLEGGDLELRRDLGLLGEAGVAAARQARAREIELLGRRVGAGAGASTAETTAAVYRFLGRTPAPLVGVSLDDLAGETEPVNLPGVPPERYPSWTRRMAKPLGAIARDPNARRVLAEVAAARARRLTPARRRSRWP